MKKIETIEAMVREMLKEIETENKIYTKEYNALSDKVDAMDEADEIIPQEVWNEYHEADIYMTTTDKQMEVLTDILEKIEDFKYVHSDVRNERDFYRNI